MSYTEVSCRKCKQKSLQQHFRHQAKAKIATLGDTACAVVKPHRAPAHLAAELPDVLHGVADCARESFRSNDWLF